MASSRRSARSKQGGSKPRYGSEVPRIFTPPLRELTPETTLGFAVIDFARLVLGIDLLPWQKWLLIHALELLEDGTFRFRTVVVLVARQNGKSTLAQVLALYFLYVRGIALVIGTAQNLDIAEEVWAGAVEMAQDIDELAEEIERVVQVNGKKALELYGGYRYKVQAANRRGGRGLSGDLVIMDELREHQTWDAWGAITKTTMARPHAQVWALSNAGDATSVVLKRLRFVAHMGIGNPDGLEAAPGDPAVDEGEQADESLGVFEWSAPPGCDLDDEDAIAFANPSLGYTITMRAILSALRTDPEWVFRTEVLCQWEERTLDGPFPVGGWEAGTDPESRIAEDADLAWCIDVAADRSAASIAVAGLRDDGHMHGEVAASRPGTDWLKGWFKQRTAKGREFRFTAQRRGAPVSSLIDDLADIDGMEYVDWSGPKLGNASALLWDMVKAHVPDHKVDDDGELIEPDPTTTEDAQRVYHLPQPPLDLAAANAATKSSGDGPIMWDRVKSHVDIAPLVAFNGAVWLATQVPEEPQRSYYAENDVEWI